MLDRKVERKYELMIIYDKASEDFRYELKKDMEEYGAEIYETKFWGLKNIPVKINGRDKGFYMVVKFKCASKSFRSINNYLMIKKNILKHFIVEE